MPATAAYRPRGCGRSANSSGSSTGPRRAKRECRAAPDRGRHDLQPHPRCRSRKGLGADAVILIAPSILSADFARLGEEVRAVDAAGADWIHVDVMDGRFVPNITIGPLVVEAVRRSTANPSMCMMIIEPERYLEIFARSGADHLLVHAEPGSTIHLHRTLSAIRALGKKAGVAFDPATSPEFIDYVLHLCDVILVMTVNPGFGGQGFLPEMLPKIRRLR